MQNVKDLKRQKRSLNPLPFDCKTVVLTQTRTAPNIFYALINIFSINPACLWIRQDLVNLLP